MYLSFKNDECKVQVLIIFYPQEYQLEAFMIPLIALRNR